MSAPPSRRDDDRLTQGSKSALGAPVTVNNFHGPVTNVHSGSGDINVGVDVAALSQFVAQLRAFAPSLSFPDTATQTQVTRAVADLAAEKDRSRAAALTARIRGLFAKASGPLKDIAIGVIDTELGKLTGV